jgi:hypothetical protein
VGLIILFVSSEALGMGNPFAGGCLAWLFD